MFVQISYLLQKSILAFDMHLNNWFVFYLFWYLSECTYNCVINLNSNNLFYLTLIVKPSHTICVYNISGCRYYYRNYKCIYFGFHSQSQQYYATKESTAIPLNTNVNTKTMLFLNVQPTFISSFTRQFIIPEVVRIYTKYSFFSEIDKKKMEWNSFLLAWFCVQSVRFIFLFYIYTGSSNKVTYASQATDTDNLTTFVQISFLLVCLYFSHLNIVLVLVNFITIYSSTEAQVRSTCCLLDIRHKFNSPAIYLEKHWFHCLL